MANAIPVRVPGTGGPTLSYTLPANMMQFVQSVNAVIDNSGGGATKPVLTVLDSSNEVIADVPQGRSLPAGGAGRATWALGLDDELEEGVTSVVSGDPELWTFPSTGPAVTIGRFSLAAQISRDALAAPLNVASGAVVVTTTNVKHNIINYTAGITANIVANPSRLVVVRPGLYLIHAASTWGNFGAADFGVCLGINLAASPLVNPGIVSRRVLNDVLVHESVLLARCAAGAIITQAVGQNSGAPIAMGIGALTAYRLGPLP